MQHISKVGSQTSLVQVHGMGASRLGVVEGIDTHLHVNADGEFL